MKHAIFLIVFLWSLPVLNCEAKEIRRVCVREKCFVSELALSEEEKTIGLMFREYLNKDKGMLFVYPEEMNLSFWMKNVLIPLDIIGINKKKEIVAIYKNIKPCEKNKCPSIEFENPAKYILEINGGMSERFGFRVGDKVFIK